MANPPGEPRLGGDASPYQPKVHCPWDAGIRTRNALDLAAVQEKPVVASKKRPPVKNYRMG